MSDDQNGYHDTAVIPATEEITAPVEALPATAGSSPLKDALAFEMRQRTNTIRETQARAFEIQAEVRRLEAEYENLCDEIRVANAALGQVARMREML